MSYGDRSSKHHLWTLDEKDSTDIIHHAVDLGINFFDTANNYSAGTSEVYLGKALKNYVSRDKVIIASKVYKNEGFLSKEAIFREIDGTLTRLGTDYLDLYVIHRFDYHTPMEETLEALNELVKVGKVREIGASSMFGYQFHNMILISKEHGWKQFKTMQNHYNLLYREDERELIPVCKQFNVSLTPHSSLAAGRLARKDWTNESLRSQVDTVAMKKYDRTREQDAEIAQRVYEISINHNVSMGDVALAWQQSRGVTSSIIGATKKDYLDDLVRAFDVSLTEEEIKYLEEPYVAHELFGPIRE